MAEHDKIVLTTHLTHVTEAWLAEQTAKQVHLSEPPAPGFYVKLHLKLPTLEEDLEIFGPLATEAEANALSRDVLEVMTAKLPGILASLGLDGAASEITEITENKEG